MPKTLWKESSRNELLGRIERLKPDAAPLWGKFTAPQMLSHLNGWMLMATGELETRNRKLLLRFAPVKQLAIYVLPFPKGLPTAPELLTQNPVDWSAEYARICRHIDNFESTHRNKPFPPHPAFGLLTPGAWGVLGYRHTDHHLRQFGV